MNMNLINVKKCSDFSGIALIVLFSQSPISKQQLGAGNSPLRAEVRVEYYPPLGVISHPKRQILGHCVGAVCVGRDSGHPPPGDTEAVVCVGSSGGGRRCLPVSQVCLSADPQQRDQSGVERAVVEQLRSAQQETARLWREYTAVKIAHTDGIEGYSCDAAADNELGFPQVHQPEQIMA